jgi:phytoene synthase
MSDRPPAGERRAAEVLDLDDELRRLDEARWLASRFAPRASRARLVALYAWHHEVARVRESVGDPLVGEIRLAWWREAVAEIYETPERARRHPTVLALRDALAAPPRPPRALFEALIDARARDLDDRRFADMSELAAYATATAGALMKLAARLLEDERAIGPALDAGLEAAGRAWGLAGLARAFPVHAVAGWVVVPGAPSAGEITRIVADHDAAAVRALTAPLAQAAAAALGEARASLKDAPATLWPAHGYVALLPGQLNALAASDPFAIRRIGLIDRARLVLAAATGRL